MYKTNLTYHEMSATIISYLSRSIQNCEVLKCHIHDSVAGMAGITQVAFSLDIARSKHI